MATQIQSAIEGGLACGVGIGERRKSLVLGRLEVVQMSEQWKTVMGRMVG